MILFIVLGITIWHFCGLPSKNIVWSFFGLGCVSALALSYYAKLGIFLEKEARDEEMRRRYRNASN